MEIGAQIRWKFLLFVFKMRRLANQWLGVRLLDYPASKILISTDTIREYETRARSSKKEPKTVSWIEQYGGNADAVFYDVGANVGAYSLIAASHGTKVIAFEPAYQNFFKLNKNLVLNKLSGLVTVIPVALSDREGIMRFKQKDSTFGATASFSSIQENPNREGLAFLVMSLDKCRATFSLPEPTMMKIDVDGAELEVLEGAQTLLGVSSLRSVLVESDEGNASKVKSILTSAKFELIDEERMDAHTVNYIFTRI